MGLPPRAAAVRRPARIADAVRICAQLYESKPGVVSSCPGVQRLAIISPCQEMPAALRRRVRRSHRVRPRRVGWFATGLPTPAFFASVLQAASPFIGVEIAVAFHSTAGLYYTQDRCQRDRRTLAGSGQHRQHTGDSGGHTGSTAASVFTGLRRARKRQRITTRRARDFRTRRAASVTVRTYPQRDNANERRRTSATEPRPRRDDG